MHPPLLSFVDPAPWAWGRSAAAAALQRASALLARAALRLHPAGAEPAAPADWPQFEFHADGGAPEGALYVDGRLVGYLPGVSRL